MRLVDDQRVVPSQLRIPVDLIEENSIGHHLDQGRITHPVGEPHGVPHHRPDGTIELVGDSLCNRPRRDPSRLGVPDHPCDATSQFETHLW